MVFFLTGILLTQLLYVLGNWRLNRSKDYLRYGLYIAMFICYIVAVFARDIFSSTSFQESIGKLGDLARRPLSIVLYIVYFSFINAFLDFKTRVPALKALAHTCIRHCLLALSIQVLLIALGIAFTKAGNITYFFLSIYILLLSFYFLFRTFSHPITKNEIVLKGSAILGLATLVTVIIAAYKGVSGVQQHFLPDFIPFFCGIMVEIFFFNLAIAHKVLQQEEERVDTQKMVIETLRQNAQLVTERQQIRNKIARDLHDELGSTLSGVVLFSELCLRSIGRGNEYEADRYLKRINMECGTMSDKMNDIIWATHQDHDTVEKLLERLKGYAAPLCASVKTALYFSVDESVMKTSFEAEKRHHFYLFSKEALNNAVKYARARSIWYTAIIHNDVCSITIQDDGCGFDPSLVHEGNGLKNMHARSQEIRGSYHIQSGAGIGTRITFQFPTYD